ncbi:hypothetical protein KC573_01040, partial [candidate division WWE3 bacterium]|nr:hypothetical protein [candidate division WWE3 bacterium]
VEEVLSGAILEEATDEPVKSFFNIPIVIGEHVAGVLTVAHKQAGLYQDEEMTILYKITQQASQAVTRLEEVVQTEQHKLNSMVQSMTEGIIMTDTEYRIVVINPIITNALQIDATNDLTLFDIMNKLENILPLQEKLAESIKLEKTVIVPEVLINDTYFKVVFAPVRSNLGKNHTEILGGVVIFHDITHDKELERMRDDFTAMMVHELRSPLGNIRRLSEYLQTDTTEDDTETAEKYLELINRNASTMLGLVNDLLDVAKMESGNFVVHKELADIREVVAESTTFFNQAANEKRINMSAVVADTVPAECMFDTQRVSQMLNNYLSNAIKFTPEKGSVSIQVVLHLQDNSLEDEASTAGINWYLSDDSISSKTPDSLVVCVTDTGAGISKDKVDQLFSKFKQMESFVSSTGEKGTGLGLSIVKGIAEAHGGHAGVATREGDGSTFFFTLPLAAGN